MKNRTYFAIDLKSFYASVECIERGLDPMTTNLVVADISRTEKTICLAVSPSLKAYGISGRSRLFEVVQRIKEVNSKRKLSAPNHQFTGTSSNSTALSNSPELAVDYITAAPQMAHYMECSAQIYNVYLKYIAPEDIHVYSIDEVFIDATDYLRRNQRTPREFAMQMILDVLKTSGITATAGIGTNLYLSKIAMDIGAKRIPPDKNGVRIAELDEMSYRQTLWTHRPLTDFWRIGRGYAKKLEAHRLFTMGDIARCSLGGADEYFNDSLLYKLFGVNAELLIDHAWGWEPCTIADIKAYKPESNSIGSGQVLQEPYPFEKARLVVREMADLLSLGLVEKGLKTNQIVMTIGYDIDNLKSATRMSAYRGDVVKDYYGRMIPKHAHGTANLKLYTASTTLILDAVSELFDRIVDKNLLVRRLYLTANRVLDEATAARTDSFEQLDLFSDAPTQISGNSAAMARERRRQEAILSINKKFGKNAILKGMNYEKDATTKNRNGQIGGHKA